MVNGQLISHYQLLNRLGRDHDAVLYRARDLRLGRDVAIRLLSPRDAQRPEARERFRHEAHIASLVTHPHICAVHDSGEEHDQMFLVCELLEGQALDETLASAALPIDRAVELGVQLVDAVAAVHRRGIVHGNIKPSNVFITTSGHVKLLEVGFMSAWWEAAAVSTATTGSSPTASVEQPVAGPETLGGFHPYQSPEQIRGERIDHRSDIFSIGALLYEMATGARAFAGDAPQEMAASIVGDTPVPARERNPLVPSTMSAALERALSKDPADRYQSATDLLADLRRVLRRLDSTRSRASVRHGYGRRRWLLPVVGAVALLVVGAAAANWWWSGARRPVSRYALLVGSVANGTNDPDFDGTLRQALVVHLGQSPYLDIVSDERLRQVLQMMGRQPDAALNHAVAREACQRLGLSAMLEGSVSAVGPATVVSLIVTDCMTGETIERQQTEVQRKEDVLQAVGGIATAMRRSLGESVASLQGHNVPIEEGTTRSLEALKAYTAGVSRRAAGAELDSIPFFERAIALDPRFALAYTTLSSVYGGLGETKRGEDYARLAYEHRASVSERERLFITYQYHDRVTGDQNKARETLEVWKQSYPRDYRPANALAVLLNRLGDYERAIIEAEEASRRNPAHPFPYSNLAYAYRGAGRYAEARQAGERAVALGIETVPTRRLLYQLAEMDGDAARAQEHLAWARSRARGFDLTGARAQVDAYRGRAASARALYGETIATAARTGFALVGNGYAAQAALTEALYGNADTAIAQARSVLGDPTYEPRLRAAAALAVAGVPGEAEAVVAPVRGERPEDTLLHATYEPVAEAAIALARNHPDRAIETLRRATAYERGSVAALLPLYFRGRALLQSKQYEDAERNFRAILQNRGVEPFSPVVPLAWLGLGRALASRGDLEGSRKAYEELQAIWRDADPDVPVVRDARVEWAAVTQNATR